MRRRGTDEKGRRFDEERVQEVLARGSRIRGKDPDLYRRDEVGNTIYRPSYGKKSEMGWEVDHKKPVDKGGNGQPAESPAPPGRGEQGEWRAIPLEAKMRRISLAALLLVCIAAGIAYAQQRSILQTFLSPTQQQSIGLNKLSATEQGNLEGVFASILSSSALGDSAVEYLKSEGWDEVTVHGTKELRLEDGDDAKEYTIAQKGSTTYILEAKTYATLSPGTYLGKMGYSSCEIIKRNGSTARFWTKKTR